MFFDGSVIIYELPTPTFFARGTAIAGVSIQLTTLFGAHSGCGYGGLMKCIPNDWSKQPDIWFTPIGKPRPGPGSILRATDLGMTWPNIIVEVNIVAILEINL